MAENNLNTRIQLPYDTYTNWSTKNPKLKKGEMVQVEVPAAVGDVTQVPSILTKTGDGEHNFNDLPWTSGLAADIYDWAKAKEAPKSAWYFNFTSSDSTADKTPAEIYAAYQAGYSIYAIISDATPQLIFPCLNATENTLAFSGSGVMNGVLIAYTLTWDSTKWNLTWFDQEESLNQKYVSYQISQDFSSEQKAQARENIGAGTSDYTPKYKTDPNQAIYLIDSKELAARYDGNAEEIANVYARKSEIPTIPTSLKNPNKFTIKQGEVIVSYDGSEEKSLIIPLSMPDVKSYGAKGDGTTDDTNAFQNALKENRCIYVPDGTYKLSGALTIRDACSMELSTGAVLDFTMISGNCISMQMSAYLHGNHAVIRVPYTFTGNVIYIASSLDTSVTAVPPYTKWDPQWKTGRYITDICIVKPDTRGFHYSMDGTCNGTAVYIEADSTATSTFIWGLNLSGLRIAGAFNYGIHAKMLNTGWCHEARIEALIDACEIGVCMEDCNNSYIAATIQPRAALTSAGANVVYAKYGIQLIRSRNTDLSGSRVWDWNGNTSLWTGDTDSGCTYQHIAMIGNCSGTILNDFLYYETSYDIRKIIYTDTASNLEKINILQEPFTRWFKPDAEKNPIFYNGAENKQLLLKDEYDATFQTTLMPSFTNQLPNAIDLDGTPFGTNGYKLNEIWTTDGVTRIEAPGMLCSGLIPCNGGGTIRLKGISFAVADNNCRVILYKPDKTYQVLVNRGNLIENKSSYFIDNYSETENGCQFTIVYTGTGYFSFNTYASTSDGNPIVTVNEELNYTSVGTLSSGIKVDYNQLINTPTYNIPTKTSELTNNSGYITSSYVDTKVASLIDSAPETLDTLKELSAALGDDPNFATTISNQIGNKADKAQVLDVTLAPAAWTTSGSEFKYTYSNTNLRASASPIITCTSNTSEYKYITDAEATANIGITFTAKTKPTNNIVLQIIDLG